MIEAQVKIVKCKIQNLPVDISFNKVGGLSTLCFMEKVDKHIGRGHLFKRSLLLIKAWCYYESRILGGSNGLFSTYALETLILHIINMFRFCLHGPLAVLYKFLEYYSSFQWEKYGVSVIGVIVLEALPKVVVERPESERDMILSEEFVQGWKNYLSIPIRAVETEREGFQCTKFNIIDPLNDQNNLGRCIYRGNYHHIRNALSYGYQKLRDIFMLQEDSINGELKTWFATTLSRRQVPGIENRATAKSKKRRYRVSNMSGDCMGSFQGLIYGQWFLNYSLPFPIRAENIDENSNSSENMDDENYNLLLQRFPLLLTTETIHSQNHQVVVQPQLAPAPSMVNQTLEPQPFGHILTSPGSKSSNVPAVSDHGLSSSSSRNHRMDSVELYKLEDETHFPSLSR